MNQNLTTSDYGYNIFFYSVSSCCHFSQFLLSTCCVISYTMSFYGAINFWYFYVRLFRNNKWKCIFLNILNNNNNIKHPKKILPLQILAAIITLFISSCCASEFDFWNYNWGKFQWCGLLRKCFTKTRDSKIIILPKSVTRTLQFWNIIHFNGTYPQQWSILL
jgi:hypothetical protein